MRDYEGVGLMDRKELIDKLKGKVIRFNDELEYKQFLNLCNEVGLETMGSKTFRKDDVWARYKKSLGFILNKQGRTYKISYLSYRLAQRNYKLDVITLDEVLSDDVS